MNKNAIDFYVKQYQGIEANARKNSLLKIYNQRGLTLLELVVVIALLSIVALAATTLVVDTGELKRQQATENQLQTIKRGIVGDNSVVANGQREYSGFVADMGRLPNCLRELVRPRECANAVNSAATLPLYGQDSDAKQFAGWRGPYASLVGENEIRDGWNAQGGDRGSDTSANPSLDDVNYGWLFGTGASDNIDCSEANVTQNIAGALVIQSCGSDGEVGVEGDGVDNKTNFTIDYPPAEVDGTDITYIPLVTRHDYQVAPDDSWLAAPVTIRTATVGSSPIISAGSLRLKFNYPTNGEIENPTSNYDATPYLSDAFPDVDSRLVDGVGVVYNDTGSPDITVPVASTLSGNILTMPYATSGMSLTFTSDSSELELQDCPCELLVDGSPIMPTSGTLQGVDSITVKSDNIAPLRASLGKEWIELPQGATISGTTITLPNTTTLTLSASALDATNYLPKIILDSGTTITIGAASGDIEQAGDLITIDRSSGGATGASRYDYFIAPSSANLTGSDLEMVPAALPVPIGQRTLTVVCDETIVAEAGELFDGDCADGVFNNLATPHPVSVSPRSYIPLPNGMIWHIN